MARAGFRIDIKANTLEVRLGLRRLALTQIPFAATRAQNKTVDDAAKAARRDLRRKFKVRNRRGNMGIRPRFAKKRDYPNGGAAVEWRDYLAQHEKGGRIRPSGGARAFAIPTRFVANRRNKGGKIAKRFKPRIAIAAGKAQVEERKGRGVIARRPPKRKSKARVSRVRLWHLLRRRIRLKPTLKARQAVLPTFKARYPRHFKVEMVRAMKTARR